MMPWPAVMVVRLGGRGSSGPGWGGWAVFAVDCASTEGRLGFKSGSKSINHGGEGTLTERPAILSFILLPAFQWQRFFERLQ